MNRIQKAALHKAINDPDAAIQIGIDLLKNASLAECSMTAGKYEEVDNKITTLVQNLIQTRGISREDMGKVLINIGIACWGSGVLLERETSSN